VPVTVIFTIEQEKETRTVTSSMTLNDEPDFKGMTWPSSTFNNSEINVNFENTKMLLFWHPQQTVDMLLRTL